MLINIIDQLGNKIELSKIPDRIVSLVPSQTEYLFDLGLENEVIGITKFCVHPDNWFRNKRRIGGTKTLDIEKITQLKPDIIFANKEENVKEEVDELKAICPVYVSDIDTLDHAFKMMIDIGQLTGRADKANAICKTIFESFEQLQIKEKIRAAYLIWREPYMTVGGNTFINDMMKRCGFENIFQDVSRYPTVTLQMLDDMGCRLLLLSSEPYPFQQKHVEEIQPLLPNTKVMLADGEMFSWYGSRLLKATSYFQELMNAALIQKHE